MRYQGHRHFKTSVEVRYLDDWPGEMVVVRFSTDNTSLQVDLTPKEARQMASDLLDHADNIQGIGEE